jgi:hypothetical protein
LLGQRAIIGTGVLLLSAAIISGCYGSTEPATNIDVDSATLNAYGDTEGSPTTSWFQYWRTSQPGNVRATGSHDLPAHVRGPLSAQLSYPHDALDPITQYSFRLCGSTEGRAPVCAQTRTFRTLDGDVVTADVLGGGGVPARVRAVSGPNGEAPRGFFIVDGNEDPPHPEDAVCVSVHGNEAVVGFRDSGGARRTLGLVAGPNPATMDVTRDPANCAGLRPSDLPPRDITATTQIHDGS